MFVKVNGTQRDIIRGYIKVNGHWQLIKNGYTKVNGHWTSIKGLIKVKTGAYSSYESVEKSIMPYTGIGQVPVYDGNKTIYIFGHDTNPSSAYDEFSGVLAFNIETETHERLTNLPIQIVNSVGVLDKARHSIMLFNGETAGTYTDNLLVYDTLTRTYSLRQGIPMQGDGSIVRKTAGIFDNDKKVYLFYGTRSNGTVLEKIYEYDVTTWTYTEYSGYAAIGQFTMSNHAAVFDNKQTVFLMRGTMAYPTTQDIFKFNILTKTVTTFGNPSDYSNSPYPLANNANLAPEAIFDGERTIFIHFPSGPTTSQQYLYSFDTRTYVWMQHPYRPTTYGSMGGGAYPSFFQDQEVTSPKMVYIPSKDTSNKGNDRIYFVGGILKSTDYGITYWSRVIQYYYNFHV